MRAFRSLISNALAFQLAVAPAIIAGAIALQGCAEEEPAPPPPPPPPPPRKAEPEPPKLIEFIDVARDMDLDPRVQIKDDLSIPDDALDFAQSALQLADAVARGDADAMRALLERDARAVLDDLIETGQWADQTERLEVVRVTDLATRARQLTLAVQDPDGAYLLAWQARASGDAFAWKGVPTEDNRKRFASDFENAGGSGATSSLPISDLNLYVRLRINEQAGTSVGLPIDNDAVMQAVALQFGSNPASVRAAYARGATEAESAGTLSASEIYDIVNEYKTVYAGLGHDIDTDDYVKWIAEALNANESDITDLYDQAEESVS